MISQEDFLLNLHELSRRIEDACSKFGRQTNEVTLLPVTKNWPVDVVRYCSEVGINRVGENRVQEALSKQDQISGILIDQGTTIIDGVRTYDFTNAITFWIGGSILSLILALTLWKAKVRD